MSFHFRYVEPLAFLYIAYLYYVIPLENQLVYHKVCLSHFNQTFCKVGKPVDGNTTEENRIEEITAQWNMYLGVARTLLAIPTVIFLGVWADGVGRKNILMFSVFGEAVQAICFLANTCFMSAPIGFMLIGSIAAGLFGSSAGIFCGVFAYIADTTTEDTRTVRIIFLEALMSLALVISNISGGKLIEKFGLFSVTNLNLLLCIFIIVYLIFLKESYFPMVHDVSTNKLFCTKKFIESLKLLTANKDDHYRRKMLLIFASYMISFFQFVGIITITTLYLFHSPRNFDVTNVGYAMAEGGAAMFLGAFFMSLVLVKKFKWSDYSVMLLGSVMLAAHALCLGLSRTKTEVYLSFILVGLAFTVPACRSALSKLVSAEDQGKLSSFIGIVQAVASLTANVTCNSIYKATVHITPSFTLYFIACMSIFPISFAILLKIYDRSGRKYKYVGEEVDDDEVCADDNSTSSSIDDNVIPIST